MSTFTGLIPGLPQTGYRHVFFDVENEANHGVLCKHDLLAPDIKYLRDRVKAGDSARLVTASLASSILANPAGTADVALTFVDLMSYHDPRGDADGDVTIPVPAGTTPHVPSGVCMPATKWYDLPFYHLNGYTATCTNPETGWRLIGNDVYPVYFGEPERHRYVLVNSPGTHCGTQFGQTPVSGCMDNYSAAQFFNAAKEAKRGGGAGWVWHTELLFSYVSNPVPVVPNVESAVFAGLAAQLATVTWPR